MARGGPQYVCQSCGAVHPKWAGRCDGCGAWNSLAEEVPAEAPPQGPGLSQRRRRGRVLEVASLAADVAPPPRLATGIGEFDRVTGGGLVAGSALLIGGDPGIGKSTLLLQVSAALAAEVPCLYVSGEEALDQIRLRAIRLGIASHGVQVAAAASVGDIAATLDRATGPGAVVVDSIQTLYVDGLESAPGTVTQVRASVQELIHLAKRRGFVLLMVGHVTKEGMIAGPRVVEHMVDTVLYFEGERGHPFRILRAVKNRFGATDEIGVFQMNDRGLAEVSNPSALFLADRGRDASGCCVFAGIEGSRPVLVEIQSLIAPTAFATPRRAVVGWDGARLAMVMAVLEARCGLAFANADVYLNVAGGLKVSEPAADLAVAAALASAASGRPMPEDAVVFGEIGLSGEVRAVARDEARLKEAAKLGFTQAFAPARRPGGAARMGGIATVEIAHVADLIARTGGGATGKRTVGRARYG
ncbi:MAG: DNA repair protein RadA [Rhodospirillales bacterium]|nr:MAG: DNA repair protein RadA [Rhodospirillales bacterium]